MGRYSDAVGFANTGATQMVNLGDTIPEFRFFRINSAPATEDSSPGYALASGSQVHGVSWGGSVSWGGHLAVPGLIFRVELGEAVTKGTGITAGAEGRAVVAASATNRVAVALEAGTALDRVWAVFER